METSIHLTPLEPWIASRIGVRSPPVPSSALAAYQLERLRETLRLVRSRSAFYRRRLAGAPQEPGSLCDLPSLPFTTAQDIRDFGPQFLCVSQDEIQRVVTHDSSGTTGNPKRLYFTSDDQELTVDFFRVGMATLAAPGDRVLILLPGARPGSVGDLLASALVRLGAQPVKHGPVNDVHETLSVMRRERVDSLVGVPTQVLALATYGPDLGLKSALLTTDHVPDAIVHRVETAWRCTVYNHYGMTEMGLGGGVECVARCGYHLREADLLFEVIDPLTGKVAPDGTAGEVVFTTLTRTGMPLIRYRTGDISRFVPEPCACSAGLKMLARVTHRVEGVVPIGEGAITLADLDEALFAVPGTLNFSATVTRGSRDRLVLDVSTAEGGNDSIGAAISTALGAIPVIERALVCGQLEVTVTVRREGYALPGPPKRTIRIQC